jgi:hypothetical protein
MKRFYPLAEFPRFGVLGSSNDKPRAARFLTPQQAKKLAQERRPS